MSLSLPFRIAWRAAWLAFVLVSCVTPPRPDKRSITLERTACMGWCPEYELTLHADGRLTSVDGVSAVIDTREFDDLWGFARVTGLLGSRRNLTQCRGFMADAPGVVITLDDGQQRRRYDGSPCGQQHATLHILESLALSIDAAARKVPVLRNVDRCSKSKTGDAISTSCTLVAEARRAGCPTFDGYKGVLAVSSQYFANAQMPNAVVWMADVPYVKRKAANNCLNDALRTLYFPVEKLDPNFGASPLGAWWLLPLEAKP